MNPSDEYFAIACHEASHAVAADKYRIPAFAEITPNGFSQLMKQSTPGRGDGVCWLEDPITKFENAVISWSGILGQCMFATAPPFTPPVKPSRKMLRDFYSMVMQQIHQLSDG